MSNGYSDSTRSEERSYIAFISYRHKELDREAAVALQKKIEHFKVPKEFRDKVKGDRLGYVFRDEDELPTSSSLSESIRYALDHTEFLIVICTPDLPASKWCEEEIRYFLSTHDRDHLLAVLANGEPDESFSPYMTNIYDENGEVTGRVEPLAANITGTPEHYSRSKFKKESIRILAALIGCPFDELWQRERRYQNKRKAIFASAAFAAMAVFAIVVGMKNLQINAKNAEITEQNRQIKEQNQQITDQNEEITNKNKELQIREGKLLSDAGELLLEGHDLKGAVENARAALSMEDVHTEGTELLLSDALGAYHTEDLRLDTAVEQTVAIDRCAMKSDGSMVYTTDRYGIVRAFTDRTEQWSYNSVPPEDLTEYLDDGNCTELYLVENETILLAGNAYYVAGLTANTGEELWKLEKKNAVNFLAVSPDGSRFAVFNDFSDRCVSIRSTKTGRQDNWFYIPEKTIRDKQGNLIPMLYSFTDSGRTRSYGGCFSSDGKYFMFGAEFSASFYEALIENPDMDYMDVVNVKSMLQIAMDAEEGRIDAYMEEEGAETAERKDELVYFLVDLEEGSIRMVGSEPIRNGLNMVFGLSYDPDKEQLFFARFDDAARSVYAGVFDRDGEVSYTLQIPNLPVRNTTTPWCFEEGSSKITASAARTLYVFDKSTGKYEGRYELDRNIVACGWVSFEKDLLLAIQDNGIYHAYPLADNGRDWNLSSEDGFAINNLTYVARSGNGIFRWDDAEEIMDSSDGKLLFLSSDSPLKVMTGEVFTDPEAAEIRAGKTFGSKSYAFLSGDGKELYIIETKKDDLQLNRIDPVSGEVLSSALFKDVDFLIDFPLLIFPGGESILYGNRIFRLDGSSTELEETGLENMYAVFLMAAASGQTTDGTVYTGVLLNDNFIAWENEKMLYNFVPNEGKTYLWDMESSRIGQPGKNALFKVGKLGQLVLGVKTPAERCYTAYDIIIPDKENETVDSQGGALPESLLCLAEESRRFAVLEQDGVIRIYDPDKNDIQAEITSPDGFTGVVDLGFAASDRYLGVLSYSGEFRLYDAGSGELLFSDSNSGLATEYGTTKMKMALSKDGKRLICIATEVGQYYRSNGAVYELDGFEHVADIPDCIAFSSEHDQAVLCRRHTAVSKYYVCHLNDTQDLLDRTQ